VNAYKYINKAHRYLLLAYACSNPSGVFADYLRRSIANCGQAMSYIQPKKKIRRPARKGRG
jgi:hypothetical protein